MNLHSKNQPLRRYTTLHLILAYLGITFWSTVFIQTTWAQSTQPKHKIVFLGDSIIAGVGDETHRGGMIGRVAKAHPDWQLTNLGFPGGTINQMRGLIEEFPSQTTSNLYKDLLTTADIFIISVGRNDFFLEINPARAIKRLSMLNDSLAKLPRAHGAKAPIIFFTTQFVGGDATMQIWLKEVNERLLKTGWNVLKLDIENLDLNPEVDGHPSAKGYDQLTQRLLEELQAHSPILEALHQRNH